MNNEDILSLVLTHKCRTMELLLTCLRGSSQPVRDPLLRNILLEPAGVQGKVLPPPVRPAVEEELAPTGLVNERANEGPEDGEDAWGADDEDTAQGLRVVGLADLDNVEQGLHARPPQVPHV